MYAKIINNKFEVVSCNETIAKKKNYKLLPNDFQITKYFSYDVNSYDDKWKGQTIESMVDDGKVIDNKGTYYKTDTAEKIIINNYNIDKPENVTELEPPEFPIWEVDKWIQDIDKLKQQKINKLIRSIDYKFSLGFEYDNKTFGCNRNDIIYWNKIEAKLNRYEFPLENIVKDITGAYYEIVTKDKAIELLDTGEAKIIELRKEYSDKETLINACSTIDQINNIEV